MMKIPGSRYRLLAGGLAALIVLAGVALAIAGGGGSGHRAGASGQRLPAAKSELVLAAKYLGLRPGALRSQLHAGRSLEQIAQATPGRSASGLTERLLAARLATLRSTQGKLGSAQEAARTTALRKAITARVKRSSLGAAGLVPLQDLPPAARYLGMSAIRLRAELQAGRSLARIADAMRGRSSAGLIAVLTVSRSARLSAAVANGALTASQEQQLLATLTRRVTAEVRRTAGR